jgi:hypothetical protein
MSKRSALDCIDVTSVTPLRSFVRSSLPSSCVVVVVVSIISDDDGIPLKVCQLLTHTPFGIKHNARMNFLFLADRLTIGTSCRIREPRRSEQQDEHEHEELEDRYR